MIYYSYYDYYEYYKVKSKGRKDLFQQSTKLNLSNQLQINQNQHLHKNNNRSSS